MNTQSIVQQQLQERNDVIEIDIREVLGVLLHYLWVIILVAFIIGGICFGISRFYILPVYDSTTKIYILSKTDNTAITYSDVQMGSQLTKDYAELIQSRYVVEVVIDNLSLEADYDELTKKITVSTPSDTRIVAITVQDTNQLRAQQIANEIREVASEHITRVMDIEAVNVVETANYPYEKAGPSVAKWTLIGAMLGAMLVIAIVMIRYILDDTIKSSDDIEKYLGISTLALIPYCDTDAVKKENSKKVKMRKNQKKKQKRR